MPTYEYECSKCGTVFDLFQPITEPPRRRLKRTDPKPCKCNAAVSRRISTGGGLIFKGSGFYLTDYRSESYKQAAEAESGATKGGDAKSGEPKPEPKPSAETSKPARAAKPGKKRSKSTE